MRYNSKRVWDEFDAEAEKQGNAIKGMAQMKGYIQGPAGSRHVRRKRNLKSAVATAKRTLRMAEVGVL